jgi:hypothetical protein
MFSFNTCHFVLFSLLSLLSANAETIRGAHRELVNEATVNLGSAGNFAILAKTGISTVPNSAITGNIGVSPYAGTFMTGFSLTSDSSGTFSTSSQVTGMCYASDYVSPTPSMMTTAVSDMETAYTDAASRGPAVAPEYLNLKAGLIGGETLQKGVYTFGSNIAINSDIYFDGTADDVFIVQTSGNVIVASGVKMILLNGVKASNIVWQVAGFVDVGTTAHMEGVLLVQTKAVFKTGSSLNGRVLSHTAVTLDSTTITQPPTV